MIYGFLGLEVDTDTVEIRADGVRIHVEPQVFDVLCYLIERRERMVSKQELLEEIFGGAFVGEPALTSRIKAARHAIGDSGREQRAIRTIHGRGYQFVADVVERSPATSDTDTARAAVASGFPTGTVTFLFTDIERSTMLWERHPDLMPIVIARHDLLLRTAIEARHGLIFSTAGDGVAAVFARASDAVEAASDIRASLDDEPWPDPVGLLVRIGLHTGEATERHGDYVGAAVNRAARVMAMAYGGQTLVSDVTVEVLGDREGMTDLGICEIDPAMPPMRLWQLGGGAFAPLAGTVAAAPPVMRTALIGRDDELERVVDLLGSSRLVSITGPGGAGKTTLALATANATLASFSAGVVFTELAAASDDAEMIRAVAEAAGIEGATDAGGVAANLARRPLLLVLDNCEHLLHACADFVDRMLDIAPAAHVLATSREPLGVDGEAVLPLLSMRDHASELFVARAMATQPLLALSRDDPRIIEICRRLDGLPLAIELAAAQLRHLGLDELLARVNDGLDFSGSGRSRGRERHQTLERTITWSYDLLNEQGRWLLRQLGVFPGTFDLATAEAIGDDRSSTLATISDLVAKNLVVRRVDTDRYQLLETIRAFARRRLEEFGESDDARERLRRHVVGRAAASSRVDRWFSGRNAASLRSDLDNARFAFERSFAHGRHRDALEILVDGAFLWRNTMHCTDGLHWLARLETASEELDPRDRMWLALMRADLGQGTAAHEWISQAADDALALAPAADDQGAFVIALHFDALPRTVAAPDEAIARLTDALVVAHSTGDQRLVHLLEAFRNLAAIARGDVERGAADADALGRRVGGDGYEVFIANWVAWAAYLITEDAVLQRHWTDRQREYLASIGVLETWLSLWSMALSSAMEGENVHDRLSRARLRADREGLDSATDTVLALALIARFEGRPTEAAELLGVVTGRRLNNTAHYVLYRALRRALRSRLGTDEADLLMQRGAGASLRQVLDDHGLAIATD